MDEKTHRRALALERRDKKFLWHPFTQQYEWEKAPTLIVASGKGAAFKDVRGRSYIDGVSSLWVNLHGHRNPVLDRALKNQIDKIAHATFLGLSHEPAIELGRELVAVAPKNLKRVFYSDNGATAVEVALKMAFQYWIETTGRVRPEFLAVRGSYHGDTMGAVSVGSIGVFHSKFKPLLFKNRFAMSPECARCPFNQKGAQSRFRCGEKFKGVPKPGDFRKETGCRWECLGDVEKNLKAGRGKIAAAILEPLMQAAGGMIAAPPGYAAGFRRLTAKHGVLLIADEVATGFGRTGTLFAVEQESVQPDFLCLAKAITGGYLPLAATLTTERIYRAFRAPVAQSRTFFHGHSYTANPLGAAVARASLKLIETTNLLEKTRRKAHLLRGLLKDMVALPNVVSIRQTGLIAGVEVSGEGRVGARVCKKLLSKGIWLRPLGNVVVLMPPPVISDKDLTRIVVALTQVLRDERPQQNVSRRLLRS